MGIKAGASLATYLLEPQLLEGINKGKGFWRAQLLHGACLSLEFVAESGLELAFGLDLPVGARKSSNFTGHRKRGTSSMGASKAQGSNSLGVKGGEERDDQESV